MATAYLADNYNDQLRVASHSADVSQGFTFTVNTAFVINDTVKLARIPGTALITLLDWYVDVPDLDSATAILVQLGDSSGAAIFMAANSVGQTGGIRFNGANGVAGALPKAYTVDDNFILTVSTGPTTGLAAGIIIKGYVRFHMKGV